MMAGKENRRGFDDVMEKVRGGGLLSIQGRVVTFEK